MHVGVGDVGTGGYIVIPSKRGFYSGFQSRDQLAWMATSRINSVRAYMNNMRHTGHKYQHGSHKICDMSSTCVT